MQMKSEEYGLTFFFNAIHQVEIHEKKSVRHLHTFEVECRVKSNEFVEFEIMEVAVNQVLNQFNNKFLNDLDCFKDKVPTLENISRVLFAMIQHNMSKIECHLIRLSVSESPVRRFIITDEN